jgi:VanZ family protein
MWKAYKGYIPAILWAGVILGLSLMPGKSLPSFNFWDIIAPDKLGHFGVYGLLTGLFFWGYVRSGGQLLGAVRLRIALYCIGYGVLLECLQHLVTNGDRHFDVLDALANTIGVGLAFWWYPARG